VTGHARRSGIEAVAPQQIAQVSETTFSVLPSHLDGHQQTEIGTLGEQPATWVALALPRSRSRSPCAVISLTQ
jgi:hypothetical protein